MKQRMHADLRRYGALRIVLNGLPEVLKESFESILKRFYIYPKC